MSAVLRALAAHFEPEDSPQAPVRAAHRYLNQRRAHLDYAGARAQGRNIGSGEIESGHRHVIQQRLKLAGSWWREPNAEKMLGLRAARANHLWQRYWSTPQPVFNSPSLPVTPFSGGQSRLHRSAAVFSVPAAAGLSGVTGPGVLCADAHSWMLRLVRTHTAALRSPG